MGASKRSENRSQLIYKNSHGEVVRVYRWNDQDAVSVVYRHDTKRIEPRASTDDLTEEGIEFYVVAKATAAEMKKKPIQVGSFGQFTFTQDEVMAPTERLAPSYALQDNEAEERRKFILIGKWVTGVQIGLIGLALLLGHLLHEEVKEEPTTTVRMVEIPKQEPVVVAPPREKIVRKQVKPVAKPVVTQKPKPQPKIVTKNAPKVPTKKQVTAAIPKTTPITGLGALGALGGMSKKMQSGGGLNLNGAELARGGDRGSGGGGVGGAGGGGMSGALFGKGLIAASNGSGARAGSAGGYGTRGKGGGRQGYGNHNIVGSSGGYAAPLDSESFVEGGLTRKQVEEVILRNMGQITYCYEKGLQIEPSLKGRVSVAFVIGASGQVSSARVQHSSVDSKQLESCVVGRVKQFQFPRPVAGVNVQVQYPFSFRRVSAL